MIESFIITFRETLEAALIIGIILSYLIRIKQTRYNKIVYVGVIIGIIASVIGAVLFNILAGGFEGRAEKIFEGITMLIGAGLLTTMILWMLKQKNIAKKLQQKVDTRLSEGKIFGLFLLVFAAVLREGIETVIFLQSASFASGESSMAGAVIGVLIAVILGYAAYIGTMRLEIKKFFNITSVLLILFGAGLVAQGVHELEEAKIIPSIIEHVWDINPKLNPNQSYPLFHENGYIGSILKGLFGYNGNPSLIEVISYIVYLVFAAIAWRQIEIRESSKQIQ